MNRNEFKKLEKTLEPYRSIIDIIQAGVNLIDKNGIIVYVNDAYCKMHHYSKEELLGKTIDMILPNKDPLEGLKSYKEIVTRKKDRPFTLESHNIRRDGSSFPVLIAWNYLLKGNEYDGMVAIVLDISKIKEVEHVLKEGKEKYRSLVENISDLIWEIDSNGNYSYVSPKSNDLFNYSPKELINKPIWGIIAKEDEKTLELLKETIFSKKSFSHLVIIKKGKHGEKIVIESSGIPIFNKNNQFAGYRGIDRDITAQETIKQVHQEMKELKAKLNKREYLEFIMGDSEKIKEVHKAVEKVAKTDFSVVIVGETGAGKEIIASSIHNFSNREKMKLISVDCGSIPENLMESELFGYKKGAFTGATESKEGAFQMANKGSIFLDEITNLSLDMQKKLLRVLQEKEVQKIGSTKKEKLDIRIISASNENIAKMVNKGTFRKDLFYRLNEFNIIIPPLRDRKEDIPTLVQRFLKEISTQLHCKPKIISKEALDLLYDYQWPGNVRELKNSLKRAFVISDSEIRPEHFDFNDKRELLNDVSFDNDEINIENFDDLDFKKYVKEQSAKIEKNIIQKVLQKFEGNKSKTSKFLNIDYKTVFQKIKDYGL